MVTSFNGRVTSDAERSTRSFAVVLTWPETKNAEYEVVQRIVAAGRNIGCDVYVIDNDGYPLWWSKDEPLRSDERITRNECDFVISLHFESPRLYDIFSYIALWNPPEFYHLFGYPKTSERLVSHNDILSCHSDMADDHARNIFQGFGRQLPEPFPTLFHSLSQPYLEPQVSEQSRLFYIGINWERITGEKGRHHDLLERLDDEDLIHIYGPEEFLGVQPWRGFKNYKGEIPFDGRSVLPAISDAGICLAFSAAAHQRSGIMSNRLFEGLAAGAVIIANPHPFIDKYFADCVYVIDDQVDSAELSDRVRDKVLEIRRNPAEALERARAGQDRLKEKFSLEFCLEALIAAHPQRVEAHRGETNADARVSVILYYIGQDIATLESMIANAVRQTHATVDVTLVCDATLHDQYKARIEQACTGAIKSLRVICDRFLPASPEGKSAPRRLKPSGPAVYKALSGLETEFFSLMHPGEHWFSDHLSTLAQALRRNPESFFASSGKISEVSAKNRKTRRSIDSLSFKYFADLVDASYQEDAGRFLFRTSLVPKLPKSLFSLLDGRETCALELWGLIAGPLAQTNYASFLQPDFLTTHSTLPQIPAEQQSEFIRDSVRGNSDWIKLRSQWLNEGGTQGHRVPRLQPNHLYELRDGGDGLAFLREGFSQPETQFVWVDGLTARLEFEFLPSKAEQELVFSLGGRRAQQTGAVQLCTVVINDQVMLDQAPIEEGRTDLRISLPLAGETQPTKMRVTLRLHHAEQVTNSEGKVLDPRHLGLRMFTMGVFDATRPRLELNHLYETREGADGLRLIPMRGGFAHPEPEFTWIDGQIAQLELELPDRTSVQELVLVVSGRRSRETGADQLCTVSVNDQVLLDQVLVKERRTELRALLPLGSGPQLSKVTITLRLKHAEQVIDAEGKIIDPRNLGLQVFAVGVFELTETGSHRPSEVALITLNERLSNVIGHVRRLVSSK
jgi:hypothetical protein